MKNKYKILIIDDDKAIGDVLAEYLYKKGFTVFTETDPRQVENKMETLLPDIVLLDVRMPHIDGMALLKIIKGRNIYTVMMTAFATKENIIEAFRMGADDYLLKPFKLNDVDIIIQRALNLLNIKTAYNTLKEEIEKIQEEQIVTQDYNMLKILEDAKRVASLDISVIIYGESGTGKDLLARFIHQNSRRREGPFVPVNLGAIPSELSESELFGYEKGAFTGANESKMGLFRAAEGGTIFLDEIGEANLNLQVKLLRVIETKRILPLGSAKELPVDVRIITATNKNLKDEVRESRFREDLFFRLNTVFFKLPPLRERRQDIPLLVEYFIKKAAVTHGVKEKDISKDAMKVLFEYDWPGNIRELRFVLERALILSKSNIITQQDIVLNPVKKVLSQESDNNTSTLRTLIELEKEAIEKALKLLKNKKDAARALGIDPSTLYRKMKKYGIKED